ncbi:hypothetical protein AAMO2058_001569300 [Amorphochlora amoebiformis]
MMGQLRVRLRSRMFRSRASFSVGAAGGGMGGDDSGDGIETREARAMQLYDYAADKSVITREEISNKDGDSAILSQIRRETADKFPGAVHMMLGPLEASLLRILVAISGAQKILEIGTFTGYSTVSMLSALPCNGSILSIDKDNRCQAVAQRALDRHTFGNKVELICSDAIDALNSIPQHSRFDFVFIDADKRRYWDYYDTVLDRDLINPGGLIVVDNVLFRGMVGSEVRIKTQEEVDKMAVDERKTYQRHTKIAQALDDFNVRVAADPRTESLLLPVRDGLTIARRTETR